MITIALFSGLMTNTGLNKKTNSFDCSGYASVVTQCTCSLLASLCMSIRICSCFSWYSASLNRKFHTSQISHLVKNWYQYVTFEKCDLHKVNIDSFGGLKSVLKFHIFIFLTCEESVHIRLVKNWYSIFTNVKNSYQFLTNVNWYAIFTNVKNRFQFLTHVKYWYQILSHVTNWYQIITDVKNWYSIFTNVNDRNCNM